jgi:hypothetical protein
MLDLYKQYLAGFGSKNGSYPTVFDEKYEDSYNIFVSNYNLKIKNEDKRNLFVILDFIRYFQQLKVSPFKKKTVITIQKIYEKLYEYYIGLQVKSIKEEIRKRNILRYLKIDKTKIAVDKHIVSYTLLVPNSNKQTTDVVVIMLQGSLYNMSKPPNPLLDTKLKFTNLCTNVLLSGWFMLDKTDNYSLSIRRCKEGLVLRKIIELDCINLGTNETTVRKVAKMYKSVNNRI